MLKIKVGDYIRTKDGVIAKITDIIDDYSIDCDRDVFDLDNIAMMEIPYYFKDEYIIKSSPNIIDLIEVGDYVNGKKVLNVAIDYIFDYSEEIKIVYFDKDKRDYIYSKVDIKSIVTHEQFESMEYKVNKND